MSEDSSSSGGEYEREPVPDSALLGSGKFWGMYAGEHTAGTEFTTVGPLPLPDDDTALIRSQTDEFEFNIIVYETGVKPTFDELRKARKKTKQEALESIDGFKPRGGTNIHDALELAFQDPEVDTVYLLTDGQPSAGRITDIDELADAVRRWNYSRQIVIHGIAVGQKSALLKRLAEESGGEYVLAR